ncbi:DpnI domain-containing protein [Microvirga aerophila]|uniref:DpnI domain-containing protein n=1 Tax=Microvirga aerophila TaxID=670291 RepID=UPI000DEEC8F4|nr:DpnI domain-containing protein [Microvirga aerophila]
MATKRTRHQQLGDRGEALVAERCECPRCKRARTLRRLPRNTKCIDIVCSFCGYTAQIKTKKVKGSLDVVPRSIPGASWKSQLELIEDGIYVPVFIVLEKKLKLDKKLAYISDKIFKLVADNIYQYAIYYLSEDLQHPEMFKVRKPLSPTARRAGWQGFNYDLGSMREAIVRLM